MKSQNQFNYLKIKEQVKIIYENGMKLSDIS